jgi:hypothetical protein
MKVIVTGILFLALAVSTDVRAASETAKPDAEKCGAAYEQCYAQCREENPAQTLKGDTARAACGSVCVAKRTTCLAGKEYEKAKPWVTDRLNKFNKFLDDFFKGPPETPSTPKTEGMKNI